VSEKRTKDILDEYSALNTQFTGWVNMSREIARHVMPNKLDVPVEHGVEQSYGIKDVYDTTIMQSALTLASGLFDYLVTGNWFSWEAPVFLDKRARTNRLKKWYKDISEIGLELIIDSNFYSTLYEMLWENTGLGTSHIHGDEDDDNVFFFTNAPAGTYRIRNNSRGVVDTVFIRRDLTAKQAVEEYGIGNLSEKITKAYNDKKSQEKFTFIIKHYKRELREIQQGKLDAENMPYGAIHVLDHKEDKFNKIVKVSGFTEKPFAVPRFLKWGNSPYGYSYAVFALPAARQLCHLGENMDILTDLEINPRILSPADLDLDLAPGGLTVTATGAYDEKPSEWLTGARADVGASRIQDKKEELKDVFHENTFTSLRNSKKVLTATETLAFIEQELIHFSPINVRYCGDELFKPILNRIFAIAFRKRQFPQPPPEAFVETLPGEYQLPLPGVRFSSKMALELKGLRNKNFFQFWENTAQMRAERPEVTDTMNLDVAFRTIGDNSGIPADYFHSEEVTAEIRAAKQQAEEEARQAALGEQYSTIAKNIPKEMTA
jgi:hypothetical protein